MSGRRTRRDDAGPFPPFEVDDKEEPRRKGITQDELAWFTLLSHVTALIERIKKDLRSFFERHPMLLNVALRFVCVPFECDAL